MEKKPEHNLIEYMLSYLSLSEEERQSNFDSRYAEISLELKEFLDEIPGGFLIYHADKSEKIIYANKALQRIFGCKNEREFYELTGNSFKGIVHPDDYERVEESIENQIHGSNLQLDYVEYRIKRRDGMIRWIEDYGHFIRSKALGDIFYVFMSDATEKISKQIVERADLLNKQTEKEQELQLIKSEHLQRLEVIEALSINYDSILYVDLNEDLVTPYRLSWRIQPIFNNQPNSDSYINFVNEYVKIWLHHEDKELFLTSFLPEYIRKNLSQSKTYYKNYRINCGGSVQYLQLRLVNVSKVNSVNQVVIGIMNVSEEVRQNLVQNQVLEDALRSAKLADIARNTFLSNVSHDMRTPLNAIFGFIELAKKNINKPDVMLGYIEKSEQAGRRILDQIDKVLQISYMQSHGTAINEAECSLNALMTGIADVLSVEAKKKSITVDLINNAVHDRVYADADKLRQVLMHIGTNAVKYTNSGGKVQITLNETNSTSDEFVGYEFIVKDNGVGISAEALGRIFNPFERERNTTNSGVLGAGLGLTIANHIMELMGGSIRVNSEANVGSEFIVTVGLKLCASSGESANGHAQKASKLKGRRVLIIEDNELNLEIETEILGDLGLICETAENGKEGYEKVKASADGYYSFVVMDIQMPVMDGWEAARAIRSLPNPVLASLPIIALSANAFESDKLNSAKAGMNAHLNKPINIDELVETVNKLIR